MLQKIEKFLRSNMNIPVERGEDREHLLKLSTATLLVEMARADFDESSDEMREVERILADRFELEAAESTALRKQAETRADDAISLHEFTRLLHEELDENEKSLVIELLWRVAYVDGQLDKYEDYLVRKVADLLYVPHAEFMRLKNKVLAERT